MEAFTPKAPKNGRWIPSSLSSLPKDLIHLYKWLPLTLFLLDSYIFKYFKQYEAALPRAMRAGVAWNILELCENRSLIRSTWEFKSLQAENSLNLMNTLHVHLNLCINMHWNIQISLVSNKVCHSYNNSFI